MERMADFIATLAPQRADNWPICKREELWGVVGRGSNWRKNALILRAGDRVFIWKGGRPNGFIAQIEALDRIRFVGAPGVVVPWPDPDWFGGVFPMRIVAELDRPIGDDFPPENGRVSPKFGFNNTVLQHIFEEIPFAVSRRVADIFPAFPAVPHLPP
jgi:diadenosine tetraphosphatase ApaH/serine/threonine PP2A family protein phosphatase